MGDMRHLSRWRGKVTSPVRSWICPLSTTTIKRKACEVGSCRTAWSRLSQSFPDAKQVPPPGSQSPEETAEPWNLPSISAKPDAASKMWWARTLLLCPPPTEKSLPLMPLSPGSHLCSEGEWSARISWREAVQGKANHLRVSLPFREGLVVETALAVASGSSLLTSWWIRKQGTNRKWHLKWNLQSLPHFLKAPHALN